SSGRRWIAPFTAGTGIASVCGPTFTMSASVIATVSGRRILKRVPCPASLCTSISPPKRLTFERTTSMPTPQPAAVVPDVAVVELRGVDAVGDGVSHQMDQRIGHQLDDRRVHFDGLAPDLEHDALAGRPRAVTHHSDERREESADGHHAGARDLAAQLAAQALNAAGVLTHDTYQAGQLMLDFGEVARDLAH